MWHFCSSMANRSVKDNRTLGSMFFALSNLLMLSESLHILRVSLNNLLIPPHNSSLKKHISSLDNLIEFVPPSL